MDLLLMVLLSTFICICLPRVLTLLSSNMTRWSLEFGSERSTPSHSEFSQPETSSELTSLTY
jgi:hypothetical protein